MVDERQPGPMDGPQKKDNQQGEPVTSFRGRAPEKKRVDVPTQENHKTENNLEESMFPEIGHTLEGQKDSPLDKNKH